MFLEARVMRVTVFIRSPAAGIVWMGIGSLMSVTVQRMGVVPATDGYAHEIAPVSWEHLQKLRLAALLMGKVRR